MLRKYWTWLFLIVGALPPALTIEAWISRTLEVFAFRRLTHRVMKLCSPSRFTNLE